MCIQRANKNGSVLKSLDQIFYNILIVLCDQSTDQWKFQLEKHQNTLMKCDVREMCSFCSICFLLPSFVCFVKHLIFRVVTTFKTNSSIKGVLSTDTYYHFLGVKIVTNFLHLIMCILVLECWLMSKPTNENKSYVQATLT